MLEEILLIECVREWLQSMLQQDLVVVPCFIAAVKRTLMIQHMLSRSLVGTVLFVGTMLVSPSPFDPETTSSCTSANLAHLRSQLFDVKLFPNGASESRSASRKRNVKTDSSAAERS
jgi:hypothetical protein